MSEIRGLPSHGVSGRHPWSRGSGYGSGYAIRPSSGAKAEAPTRAYVTRLTTDSTSTGLALRVHLVAAGDRLEATGRTTLRQTAFGITAISKAGLVKVKDELTIVWRFAGSVR